MKAILVFLIILVAGCKSNQQDKICDSDFNIFFRKFAGDSVFQKKHVHFPLISYYNDNDDLKHDQVSENNYTFTDFTNDEEQYKVSIDIKKDSATYTRFWRESYGAMIYKFARKNNCWMLVEFRDITD